ncbi:hypothetical protein P280DRAFT_463208 [Massarina eburnea CBS 473.64]|uniref:Pinin/SDK/MemA protein domain-containing protein n=1 Tax=Massarina eburnea CBS 473.64 TaxID=1395130 RepID=A0A6A6RH98_9PLEO|nr:hypothetical protein P280DRAFT_463208 [Massarina eburnea CBS 473.64]
MDASIASAVVLPDPESPPRPASSPSGTKRRQSSVSDHDDDAKRARLDGDSVPSDRRESTSTSTSHAPVPVPVPKGRERGRERRLFGAVLGALSQNSATAGQRRRTEIEKRQQAQRKLDDEESEQRKSERLARRKAQRWREQKNFEKASMHLRHDNLLAMAHFLRTTSEPQLLYKPWETTPGQDDRIRDQIADAQDTIRRELEGYERQQEVAERERSLREGLPDRNAKSYISGKEHNAETRMKAFTANDSPTDGRVPPANPEQQDDPADPRTNEAANEGPSTRNDQHSEVTGHEPVPDDTNKEAMDEIGEEVVEAGEDMVIY